jgi:hypothetical protein
MYSLRLDDVKRKCAAQSIQCGETNSCVAVCSPYRPPISSLLKNMWKKLVLAITSRPSVSQKMKSRSRGDPTQVFGPETLKFVALEYYGLILNRTYLIAITNGYLCGANVGGLLASKSTPLDPNWYLNQNDLKRCRENVIGSDSFLNLNSNNFRLGPSQIVGLKFDDSPKWGMGVVPYSGRFHFKLSDGTTREFILLGYQDGQKLHRELCELGYGGPSSIK